MKKLKYLLLLLCFTFLITGCDKKEKAEIQKSNTTPLLLEVSKEGVENKLYLFGSIHVADESLYPLPDYVLNAYQKSDAIAVEFDIIEFTKDLSNQIKLLSKFLYTDKTKITDYIENDIYTKGVELLKSAKLYNSMMDYYQPIMWQSLIENVTAINAGLDEAYGIDQYLLTEAKKDNKTIIELESAEYQYNMLLGFDIDMQVYLLNESIKQTDKSKENMVKLYDLYKKGNQNELEKFVFEEESSDSYMEQYNNALITVRNQNMTESLEQKFQEGQTIFCTVGLAHIIGNGGIADLLEQKGYTVTTIME